MYAQDRPITGTVKSSEDGRALPGVTVLQKGTSKGTVTDLNGNFSITVPEGATLVFSFVGLSTQEVPIGTSNVIDVILEPDYARLDEIVVIGYGTQKKADVTSSITTVKSDDFVKGAVKDAAQLIQGKVAGLSVTTPSGNPVSEAQIMLRGITSIYTDATPLILIDGVPGNLNTVAPENIESIDVLKDGSAAAIYGTRGTNGVILITTEKMQGIMPATIEYSAYTSTQTIAKKAEFLMADDYRRLIAQGEPLTDYGATTDWFDEITRTPVSHMHHLVLKGGNGKTNYIGSVNYKYSQGIFKNSDVNRINSRLDVNHSMFDGILSANINILGGSEKYWAGGDGYSFNTTIYRQALIRNPTDAIKDANGDWVEHPGVFQYENPVAWLKETDGENRNQNFRLSGSLTLNPISGLKTKLLLSTHYWNQTRGYSETKNHISNVRDGLNGYASRGSSSSIDNLLELTAEYNKAIDRHRFTLLGGYSYQDYVGENFWINNRDFPTDAFSYNNMDQGNGLLDGLAGMDSYKSSSKLIGFFGRVNYSYADRYLLMASVRREGSSKFGENNQWGTFPAVSVGWRISNEPFLQSLAFVDELKLRAGYGVTGTEPNDPYMSLTRLTYGNRILVDGEWIREIRPSSNPNPDLRWERKAETNIGLDFALFESRVSGTIDVYKRNTKDMLWNYQVPTPPYLYNSIIANVGEIENKGVEVLLQLVPVRTPNFDWISSFNYSTNSNKLVSLTNDKFQTTNDFFDTGYTGDPIQQSTHRVKIGGPIGDFYGYKSIDIDDSGIWIIEDVDGNPVTSNLKTTDDKKILGNGLPKHYASWNNTFRYKNFDLNITMRGAFGFQILNFQRMFYENPTINIRYNVLESAYDNVYGKNKLEDTQEYVSYYIEDGDYWKIDNIILGYTFNVDNVNFIDKARVYVSGLNMFTITGYKGVDPEVNRMGLSPGNDERDKYPTTRTYSFGINLTF